MTASTPRSALRALALIMVLGFGASGCATTPPVSCALPQTTDIDFAVHAAKRSLSDGCATHFHDYLGQLLVIAEGDPQPEHKRLFSDFLVWASDEGLLAKRQARELYNRYFNVKFVTLMEDYNNCTYTCPRQSALLKAMEGELVDKELGLLKISLDKDGYYRADRLYQETELVLAAMCSACINGAR